METIIKESSNRFRWMRGVASVGARRLVLTGVLFLTSLATIGASFTGAVFNDTESVGSNSFSTGTVDVSAAPASAVVSLTNMAPGDLVTAPLTVSNAGSLEMRYALTSVTTENTLAAQLDMTIKTGVSTCSTGGFAADGTALYGPGDMGSASGINMIGDPTTGAQSGDRTLIAASNEVLCIQVSLPLGTGNSFQGLTTAASLNFAAEQTTNN
ncbi:MAG: TasA family protein [SAR202 cluster bacterium]|nr:TasA family protein [SAR202 cluster bacterium]MDP6714181.1 TasA family protein [SAR202 cluster bacterium]